MAAPSQYDMRGQIIGVIGRAGLFSTGFTVIRQTPLRGKDMRFSILAVRSSEGKESHIPYAEVQRGLDAGELRICDKEDLEEETCATNMQTT